MGIPIRVIDSCDSNCELGIDIVRVLAFLKTRISKYQQTTSLYNTIVVLLLVYLGLLNSFVHQSKME